MTGRKYLVYTLVMSVMGLGIMSMNPLHAQSADTTTKPATPPSSTPTAPITPPGPGLSFPQTISGFKLAQETNFEGQYPGLGWSAQYFSGRTFMDIYIYTHGQTNISDDVTSETVQHELETAKAEIVKAVKKGVWENADEKASFMSSDDAAKFQCLQFELEQTQDKGYLDSYLCLKSWKGRFLRIRLNMPPANDNTDKAKVIASAWAQYLKSVN